MDNNEGIKEFEAQGGHDMVIHCHDFREMISEEGSPSLLGRKIPSFIRVFCDSRLSDVKSEFYQFSMATERAPEQIFVIYTLD